MISASAWIGGMLAHRPYVGLDAGQSERRTIMERGRFSAATEALLERAGQLCAARGARLTDLRREVLGLILDTEGPAGAYDLLDRLKAIRRGRRAPDGVSRARLPGGARSWCIGWSG